MKIACFSASVVLAVAAFTSGCGKTEESVPPPAAAPAPSAPMADTATAIDATTTAVQQTGAELQNQAAAAGAAAESAVAKVQDQAPAITSNVQATLDDAKKLLAEGKWSEALVRLNQLATMKLTPEQQATLAQLKQQAQALAQQAAAGKVNEKAGKAIGDLLPKR
jgi:hypothetical protein